MSVTYEYMNGWTLKVASDGERQPMANFIAEITEETRYSDGENIVDTILTVIGHQMVLNETTQQLEQVNLDEVRVTADEFASMNWVMRAWGVKAVIWPGSGVKDNLRTAIQQRSTPKIKVVHRHTGWGELNGRRAYLHAGGAVTASGTIKSAEVSLPHELRFYDLSTSFKPTDGLKATLNLLELGPPETAWSMLAATIAPLFGPVDFGVHVSGRTGTFKSETASLWQSHYGAGMDARHLPASWSSTANALEAQAYIVKDATITIDDFVPHGSSWRQRQYQATAEKVLRAAGNQAGRARMTDVSSLQKVFWPRGMIISTGEDAPEGHSIRARLWILETTPGDIDPKALTKAQEQRPRYPATIVAITQQLARFENESKEVLELATKIRDANLDLGHTRTPSTYGRLVATTKWFCAFCRNQKVIDEAKFKKLLAVSEEALGRVAEQQQSFLESADPCDAFCLAVRQVLANGQGHFRTIQGGIPRNPESLGWSLKSDDGGVRTYFSHGVTLGWINWDKGEVYLEANNGVAVVKRVAGNEIPLSRMTLLKRLKDSGMLLRVDDQRQRNTVRITAENHPRQVIVMRASQVLDNEEVPAS